MKVISIKENPEYKDMSIKYIQSKWANEKSIILHKFIN